MTETYVLPEALCGYPEGTVLRDVPLREARSWECNRCGDCCDGTRDGVVKDEATGLPKFTWGEHYPEDLYKARFGQRLLQPIVMVDGGIEVGDAFEVDADGQPYTAFKCSMLRDCGGGKTACHLYGKDKDPKDLSTIRPRNCGEFPVFGLLVDDAIISGQPFIPPTGSLPRCTWHGIRVVGPWKETPNWRTYWEAQQRGEDIVMIPAFTRAEVERMAKDSGGQPNGSRIQDQ